MDTTASPVIVEVVRELYRSLWWDSPQDRIRYLAELADRIRGTKADVSIEAKRALRCVEYLRELGDAVHYNSECEDLLAIIDGLLVTATLIAEWAVKVSDLSKAWLNNNEFPTLSGMVHRMLVERSIDLSVFASKLSVGCSEFVLEVTGIPMTSIRRDLEDLISYLVAIKP